MAKAQRGSEPRPRRATGAAGTGTPGKSKVPKAEAAEDEDLIGEARRKREDEEITTEAIPVTELRKSLCRHFHCLLPEGIQQIVN